MASQDLTVSTSPSAPSTDAAATESAERDMVDAYCDLVPRSDARAEPIGAFTLFVADRGRFQFYARPSRRERAATAGPAAPMPRATAADVTAVRNRQRELGVPQAFEWIDELHPGLDRLVTNSGLSVFHAPLLVHRGFPALLPPDPHGIALRVLADDDPALPGVRAAVGLGFTYPGTGVGLAGEQERAEAEAAAAVDPGAHTETRANIAAGRFVLAGAFAGTGPVGGGGHSPRGGITEITGVATIPLHRRRGVAAALTTLLVRDALSRGVDTCFLAAGSATVAQIYARVGFARIGTACIASEPGDG